MKRTNSHYSLEFKLHAVELSKHKGFQKVANELNISRETLRNWTRGRYLGNQSVINKPKSKEEEENIKLKKKLYEIKLEPDILKKALGTFSKSDK